MNRLVLLLLLLASCPSALAAEVSVEGLQGPMRGAFFGIRWDDGATAGKTCSVAQARPRAERKWVEAPAASCERVRKLVKSEGAALDRSVVADPSQVELTYGTGTGVLTLGKKKIVVNLMTAPSCDASLKNCTEPKLDAGSRVALEVRTQTTGVLGRLAR